MSNETDWFKHSLKLGAALKRAQDESLNDPKTIVQAYHKFQDASKCNQNLSCAPAAPEIL